MRGWETLRTLERNPHNKEGTNKKLNLHKSGSQVTEVKTDLWHSAFRKNVFQCARNIVIVFVAFIFCIVKLNFIGSM